MSFSKIISHEQTIENLTQQIEKGRINSSYIFTGLRGIGKRTVIEAFAKTILCLSSKTTACGDCKSCRAFENNHHPDYLVLIEEKNEISVREMRELCNEINKKPTLSNSKVCFIPNSTKMNTSSANCFLKTLEEPPQNTHIILRAEGIDGLLKTIISRCQIIRMTRISDDEIIKYFHQNDHNDETKIAIAVEMAEGSIGKALEFSDKEFQEKYLWLKNNLSRLRPADALSLSEWLISSTKEKNGFQTRNNINKLFELLTLIFRKELRHSKVPRNELKKLELLEESMTKLSNNVTPEVVLRSFSLNLSMI